MIPCHGSTVLRTTAAIRPFPAGFGLGFGKRSIVKSRQITILAARDITSPLRSYVNGKQERTMSTKVTTHETLGVVSTTQAPAAIGPYSQAIKVGNLVFCSGCIPLDPSTMQVVEGGVEKQTEQALKNLKAVVEASGSTLGKVVKTTVFLKSMDDFAAVNGIYASVFGDHKPARSAVEVARLPKDVLVEVEAIASLA